MKLLKIVAEMPALTPEPVASFSTGTAECRLSGRVQVPLVAQLTRTAKSVAKATFE